MTPERGAVVLADRLTLAVIVLRYDSFGSITAIIVKLGRIGREKCYIKSIKKKK